jgi:poly(beta-D-mannuronate) lyase
MRPAAIPLFFGLLAACVLAACADVASSDGPLRNPFDVAAMRAARGHPIAEVPCAAPVPPVTDVEGVPIYVDAQHSVRDTGRAAAELESRRPLDLFVQGLQASVTRWVESDPPRPEAAACALGWLDDWARAGAMLGAVNTQGGYDRKMTLAGAALAFLAIRDAPGLDPAEVVRVTDWLVAVAKAVRPFYDKPPRPGEPSPSENNHAYWAGVAVGAVAIAANDRAMFDWAMQRAVIGLDQVTPAGALPMELARGSRALEYHLFALAPLAALDLMGHANGIDLDPRNGGALGRLARFCFRAAVTPEAMAALAGAPQANGADAAGRALFLADAYGFEVWLGGHPDPEMSAALAPFRPFRQRWLGGDVTLLFNAAAPAG